MTRTQLYLPESQYEDLKRFALASGRTFAALVREFLEERLREAKTTKQRDKKQGLLSAMEKSLKKIDQWKEKGVVRDGSTSHDSYLYRHENLLR